MDDIKQLTFLYTKGYGDKIGKVKITKHTDKSIMIGTARLPIKDLRNGEWYVSGGGRFITSGTHYYIPNAALDNEFATQLELYKVDGFLRGITAQTLKENHNEIFCGILQLLQDQIK